MVATCQVHILLLAAPSCPTLAWYSSSMSASVFMIVKRGLAGMTFSSVDSFASDKMTAGNARTGCVGSGNGLRAATTV